MISAGAIANRMRDLDHIGVGPEGVLRLAWTAEDAACREWFFAQAAEAGLDPVRDPAGNLWACPRQPPPWWAVGSHLDSVRGGGRFDGPLGVACGFEIAARAQRPVAVLSFADEEGARFNTPTFGSKALTGKLDLDVVLKRRDDDGIALADAVRAAGVDPDGISEAAGWLPRLCGFVEIHIDQTTDLAARNCAAGVVSSLAARRRLEVELDGRADHAGTTPPAERRDALSAAAHLIVAAEQLAGGFEGVRTTASRIVVQPNAPTTIASHVKLWLDARAAESEAVEQWGEQLGELAAELSARTGVDISTAVASQSDPVGFDQALRARLERAAEAVTAQPAPQLVCFAGHDAGILADRLPAAMVFVRNPTGISHSPHEQVALEDAAVAATVVERALVELTGRAR
jgi:N-carbamoyl-L-amino-acid hydrolase